MTKMRVYTSKTTKDHYQRIDMPKKSYIIEFIKRVGADINCEVLWSILSNNTITNLKLRFVCVFMCVGEA